MFYSQRVTCRRYATIVEMHSIGEREIEDLVRIAKKKKKITVNVIHRTITNSLVSAQSNF